MTSHHLSKNEGFQGGSSPWSLSVTPLSHTSQPPFYFSHNDIFQLQKVTIFLLFWWHFIYYSPCPGPSSHVSLNEWPVLSPVSGIIFWIHKIRLADSVIDSHSTMHCLCHCSYHTILTFPDFFIFYSTFKLLILEEESCLVNNGMHFLALDRYLLAHDKCYKYVYWINE